MCHELLGYRNMSFAPRGAFGVGASQTSWLGSLADTSGQYNEHLPQIATCIRIVDEVVKKAGLTGNTAEPR